MKAKPPPADRNHRLAAALRDNLKRRKAQARERAEAETDRESATEPPSPAATDGPRKP